MPSPKIVIASVPYVNTPRPLAAPAVLKSALTKHGFDCVAIDLNIDVENKVANHNFKFKFVDFFKNQIIHDEIVDELALMVDYCVEEILSHNPTIVGLSLFCHTCQTFTSWLSAAIKQKNPNIKIVIGGPGIQVLSGAMIFDYPSKLKRLGLIDDFITGDGENSIVEYVKGNRDYPGINSSNWTPVDNLNNLPIPDYSDYRWYKYAQPSIPIIDSRGCVQSCEFCDVIAYWKKFQFLTAENIFSQMLVLMKKHQLNKFDFRSSISNGNLKEFKKLIKLLGDHNNDNKNFSTEKILWDGSFIIRSAQHHDEEFWKQLKDSNPDRLFVGVESVVERVRVGLGKNFTNADLDHFLAMTQKYQIPVNLLCISGYPTETEEEYEFSKQWFRDRKEYAHNSISGIQMTSIGVLPGTSLIDNLNIEEFGRTRHRRAAKYEELCEIITDSGFALVNYTLMDRPD